MPNTDVYSKAFTSGDLNTIEWLTSGMSIVIVTIISVVGFGIIMASIGKNALAGLYAVFPRFWDKVHNAHVTKIELSLFGKGQSGSQVDNAVRGIASVLYSFVPDLKVMTEFDDENGAKLDAKAFFLKALPMCVVQIFIGAFIFFGYPTEVAAKVATVGTNVIDLVIVNFDPVGFVEDLPGEFVLYSLSTDDSDDPHDQLVNDIAYDAIEKVSSALDDMPSENRLEIGDQLEGFIEAGVNSTCGGLEDDPDGYDRAYTVRLVTNGDPDISKISSANTEKSKSFAFTVPVNQLSHGSLKENIDNMYLRVVVKFSKNAGESVTAKAVDCDLHISKSAISGVGDGGTISLGAAGITAEGYASIKGDGFSGDVTTSGETMTITMNSTGSTKKFSELLSSSDSTSWTLTLTNVYYNYNGLKHRVKTISISKSGNGAPTLSLKNSSDKTWSIGSPPINAKGEEVTNTTPTPTPVVGN